MTWQMGPLTLGRGWDAMVEKFFDKRREWKKHWGRNGKDEKGERGYIIGYFTGTSLGDFEKGDSVKNRRSPLQSHKNRGEDAREERQERSAPCLAEMTIKYKREEHRSEGMNPLGGCLNKKVDVQTDWGGGNGGKSQIKPSKSSWGGGTAGGNRGLGK